MRNTGIAIILSVLMTTTAFAADASKDKKVEAFKLKDGSAVTIFESGGMKMTDSQGKFFAMKEGERMETTDGQIIMMKEGALWKQIRTKGTLHPSHNQ